MDKSRQILSDIVVYMKYAKYIPELERRETFDEIVDRNIKMHQKKYPKLKDEIKEVYEKFVKTKKILPSMRSMQFAGKPIEVNPSRIYNCCFLPIDDWRAFSETMFLLLGGTGVGFSVQKHHVEKLPVINRPNPKRKRRFLIGDSIEGWADAVKVLMKSYFYGTSTVRFDYSDIRPKGSLLVTSGGKAPGPEPLRICLDKVRAILEDKQDGEQLTTIEVHDIICHLADAVLAGGIRRAALISIFSADDDEVISAKSGEWWELNPQRGRANNSAVLVRSRMDEEFFKNLWQRVEASNSGEPGIFLTNDKDLGTNPCAEISLKPNQFCVSGDTKLITRKGIENIENVVGKEVEIWNGEKWSKVKPYKTGDNDRLHRVWFSDGSYLDATDNHKFLVKNRFQKDYREVETLELIELLKTSKYGLQIPRSNINYEGGVEESKAYDYGFILGDGFVHKNNTYANLFSDDKLLEFESSDFVGDYYNYNGTKFTTVKYDVDDAFAKELKYSDGLHKDIFSWDRESILNFIAGWADADGSKASKGIRIYGREDKIRDGQLLLSKIGINSSVNLMSKKGEWTNLGERKNDVWYLQITKTCDIPTQRLVCENSTDCRCKGKHQLVKRIDTLDGLHKSYCLTEDELHQCVFNNVLTKQCNLCEVNVSNIENQEDLNERIKSAAFIGTLQAGYTDFHYLRNVWQRTTEKDALLGIGLTGIASCDYKNLDFKEASKLAKKTNEEIAEKIGINKASRLTTIKPSGTSSSVLGTSSGIHAWHNDFYIRRIRVGKNESIYTYLKINHPELIEDEYFRPHDTAVISIPIKAPKDSILRTETPIQTLNRVKWFHKNWIKPGHRSGLNTHNISCTISIKDNEWDKVGDWMWRNRKNYTAISVLPYDGGSYVQAPFEDIDEEKYNELYEALSNVDLTKVVETEDNTDLQGELACTSDGCEII